MRRYEYVATCDGLQVVLAQQKCKQMRMLNRPNEFSSPIRIEYLSRDYGRPAFRNVQRLIGEHCGSRILTNSVINKEYGHITLWWPWKWVPKKTTRCWMYGIYSAYASTQLWSTFVPILTGNAMESTRRWPSIRTLWKQGVNKLELKSSTPS